MLFASVLACAAALSYSPRGAVLQPRAGAAGRSSAFTMADDVLKCDVRKLPQSAIALDITVPKSVSKEIHLKTLARLAKGAKVPGFRDGKVPPQAIVAKLGIQKVKEATVEQIVDVGMTQSGVGQKIQTVGDARMPEELEKVAARYSVGEPLSFTIEVDVYPDCPIEEEHYKGLSVDVERAEFNQEAYDNALFKLRNQHADLIPRGAGVPAAEGNEILVDMEGFLANPDGTAGAELPAVAGGSDVQVPLAPGKFMPGLVEGLVGACDGDVREIKVVFPPRSSVPQLAGKEALFKVTCKCVQERVLPEPGDAFAEKVRSGMTYAELDAKLREGVEEERAERENANTHAALTKALVAALPAAFEVPMTLVEGATKEKFAMMLAEMREQGTTDEKLKEIVTPENYERYKKISKPMTLAKIKGDFAIKAIAQQQGLVVDRNTVDDEVMTLQAQSLQRGEKFKESEARPRVEQTLERRMVLDWMQSHAKVALIDPKTEEESVEELLGASPEELAASLRTDAPPPQAADEPAAPTAPAPTAPAATKEPPAAEAAASEEAAGSSAPGGFEWGGTF